jgi:hypothetical protein
LVKKTAASSRTGRDVEVPDGAVAWRAVLLIEPGSVSAGRALTGRDPHTAWRHYKRGENEGVRRSPEHGQIRRQALRGLTPWPPLHKVERGNDPEPVKRVGSAVRAMNR